MVEELIYRVWCLSWEDTEEHGKDVVFGDDLYEDTRTQLRRSRYLGPDAEEAVEQYADWCHSNRDGWDCEWPLKFRVRSPDGTTADYEVDRDYDPTFTARRSP